MSKSSRKKYTKEFKLEAVKLMTDQGYSLADAGQSLGVNPGVISRWRDELSNQGKDAFPGNGKALGMEEELRRLREENRRLKMEREILKKATVSSIDYRHKQRWASYEWGKRRYDKSGTTATRAASG